MKSQHKDKITLDNHVFLVSYNIYELKYSPCDYHDGIHDCE